MANRTWRGRPYNPAAIYLIILALVGMAYFIYQRVFAANEAERCVQAGGVPAAARNICVDPATGEDISGQ